VSATSSTSSGGALESNEPVRLAASTRAAQCVDSAHEMCYLVIFIEQPCVHSCMQPASCAPLTVTISHSHPFLLFRTQGLPGLRPSGARITPSGGLLKAHTQNPTVLKTLPCTCAEPAGDCCRAACSSPQLAACSAACTKT